MVSEIKQTTILPLNHTLGLMTDINTPRRVRLATVLLWTGWVLALVVVIIECVLSQGISPALSSGFGTALQAVLIIFIARGSRAARVLEFIVLLFEAPLVLISAEKWAEVNMLFGLIPIIDFILRAIAIYLLITGESRAWFANHRFLLGVKHD